MISRLLAIVSLVTLLVSCCAVDTRVRSIDAQLMVDLNDATAALVEMSPSGTYHASCSGVWLSSRRMITAAHCVSDAGMTELDRLIQDLTGTKWNPVGKHVHFLTWREALSRNELKPLTSASVATVVAYDEDKDLALVESGEGAPEHGTVSLAMFGPQQGDVTHSVGMTAGLLYSYTPGVVGAVRNMENVRGKPERMIQVISGAHRGNSGGGLFDSEGRLLGICSFIVTGTVLLFYVETGVVRGFLETH